MGWSLLPNALRPFKIYCAFPPITSQLVLFLWQTVETGPMGHVRVVRVRVTASQAAVPGSFSEGYEFLISPWDFNEEKSRQDLTTTSTDVY